jgi:predicted alpha/beta superfamily hydrolase
MTHFPLANLPATEVRTLRSSAVDKDYLISVARPFGYDEHPESRYPVIYVLDANMSFGIVVETMRILNIRVPWSKEFPDAIVVGIGYPLSGSLTEIYHQMLHLRMRDFLPRRDEGAEKFIQDTFPVSASVVSGGAGDFLHFIQHELIPMIEAEYRADPADRTLERFPGCFTIQHSHNVRTTLECQPVTPRATHAPMPPAGRQRCELWPHAARF